MREYAGKYDNPKVEASTSPNMPQLEQDRLCALVLDHLMAKLLERSLGHTLRQNLLRYGPDAALVTSLQKVFGIDEYVRLLNEPDLTEDEKVWYDAHRRSMTAAVIAGSVDGSFAAEYKLPHVSIDQALINPTGDSEV